MASPRIRADYEQLKDVAGRFGSQAQAARQTLQRLQQQVNVLQGGDWIGQGASAFYTEMGDSVLPTFQRLIRALDAAAQQTTQMGAIMQDAEDQAARVLKGSGVANGATARPGPASVDANGSGAPVAGPAVSSGAVGSGMLGGASTAGAADLASSLDSGASQPGPASTPPDTSRTVSETLNELADTGGIVGGIISALEAAGAAAFSEGVVGTSIGSLLLPIAAYKLGRDIGVEQARQAALMDQFKQKLTGSAVQDAVQTARAQMQAAGTTVRGLNEQGQAAVKAADTKWRSQMEKDINLQLIQDSAVFHAHIEHIWQAHYDDWVKGMSNDLAAIYADPHMTH